MITRKQLLERLKEIEKDQSKAVEKASQYDRTAQNTLMYVRGHIEDMANDCFCEKEEKEQTHYLFHNIDYRTTGDNHSEVNKTPVFKGCRTCCGAIQWLQRLNGRQRGEYHSIGKIEEGQQLNKKIVVYAGRTFKESQMDDELIINSEYLN